MKLAIVGSPSCRKSTTAEQLNVKLKQEGLNSVVCPEVARTYIGRYGAIKDPWEQLLLFFDQTRHENELSKIHDFVICDSASWLGYVYTTILIGDSKDRKLQKLRQEIHTMVLKYVHTYDLTLFMPVQEKVVMDGVRTQNDNERLIIQNKILGFMNVENIPYITVTGTVPEKTQTIYDNVFSAMSPKYGPKLTTMAMMHKEAG